MRKYPAYHSHKIGPVRGTEAWTQTLFKEATPIILNIHGVSFIQREVQCITAGRRLQTDLILELFFQV